MKWHDTNSLVISNNLITILAQLHCFTKGLIQYICVWMVLPSIEIAIVEIRRSYDRLLSTMGFPLMIRPLYFESGPRSRSIYIAHLEQACSAINLALNRSVRIIIVDTVRTTKHPARLTSPLPNKNVMFLYLNFQFSVLDDPLPSRAGVNRGSVRSVVTIGVWPCHKRHCRMSSYTEL